MIDARKRLMPGLAFLLLCGATGCPASGAEDDSQDGAVTGPDGGPGSNDGEDGDGSDGSAEDGDLGDGDVGDGEPDTSGPVLEGATARQVGRFGDDVRVDVLGSDENGDATSVALAFHDASDAPVPLFDSDGDGVLDSSETLVALSAPLTAQSGASTFVTFARLRADFPELHHVTVQVVDEAGNRSAELEAELSAQPELPAERQCDPEFLENRCALGLGCKGGTPKICAPGESSMVTRSGYFSDELGRRVLVEGSDPDGDATAFTVEFLDAAGSPVALDLDGDGSAEATSFRQEVGVGHGGTEFFFSFEPSQSFVDAVAKVAVTVHDAGNLDSERKVLTRGTSPQRSTGVTCDARGFDRCSAGSVCSPGVAGQSNRCTSVVVARTATCGGSETLKFEGASGSVRGELTSASLWDAPAGCSSNDPVRRPEGVVKIVLAKDAERLVISSDNAYTDFDTTLYLIAACNEAPVSVWCADDQSSGARAQLAVLELADVPAGDYFVVVDSFPSSVGGKRFQLDVSVE